MKNNIVYIVLGVVALVLAGIATLFYLKPPATAPATPSATTSAVDASVQAGETAKTGVSDAVGKTNPFQTNVNPVSGYQNPFGQ